MNPFEMVLGIILIVTVGRVLRARYGVHQDRRGNDVYSMRDDAAVAAENHRLRAELAQIKERVQVLERVVTDTEGSVRLDREIEKLRDARND